MKTLIIFISIHHGNTEKITRENFDIIREFSCRGFDTVGPFKLIGGISKGRPNEKDLKRVENFVKNLKNKMKSLL